MLYDLAETRDDTTEGNTSHRGVRPIWTTLSGIKSYNSWKYTLFAVVRPGWWSFHEHLMESGIESTIALDKGLEAFHYGLQRTDGYPFIPMRANW